MVLFILLQASYFLVASFHIRSFPKLFHKKLSSGISNGNVCMWGIGLPLLPIIYIWLAPPLMLFVGLLPWRPTLLHVVISLGGSLVLPLLPNTLYLVGTSSHAVCWTAALKAHTASCSNVTGWFLGLIFTSNHFIFGWNLLSCCLLDCCLEGTHCFM